MTASPTAVPATRWAPRTTCCAKSGAPSGTTAETIAQYGCPMPAAVAPVPASSTAIPLRATCQRHRAAYVVRAGRRRTGAGPRSRRSTAPAAPTSTAKAAESPATTSATSTSRGRLSSDAQRGEGEDQEQRAARVPVLQVGEQRAARGEGGGQRHRQPGPVLREADHHAPGGGQGEQHGERELHPQPRDRDVGAAVERGDRTERRVDRPLLVAEDRQHDQRDQHRDPGPERDAVGARVRPDRDQRPREGAPAGTASGPLSS